MESVIEPDVQYSLPLPSTWWGHWAGRLFTVVVPEAHNRTSVEYTITVTQQDQVSNSVSLTVAPWPFTNTSNTQCAYTGSVGGGATQWTTTMSSQGYVEGPQVGFISYDYGSSLLFISVSLSYGSASPTASPSPQPTSVTLSPTTAYRTPISLGQAMGIAVGAFAGIVVLFLIITSVCKRNRARSQFAQMCNHPPWRR